MAIGIYWDDPNSASKHLAGLHKTGQTVQTVEVQHDPPGPLNNPLAFVGS